LAEGSDTQFKDSVEGLTLLRGHLSELKKANTVLLSRNVSTAKETQVKSSIDTAFPFPPTTSPSDDLGKLLDSVAMFSVPRQSFGTMIYAQYEVCQSILTPCSSYKFDEFVSDPEFCALVFDVTQQTIKSCIPETNNPILFVETQSFMQILITQSKMAALYAFFAPTVEGESDEKSYLKNV
jgi:hypothetical protein